MNADGHPDLVFENTSSGDHVIWYLGGAQGNVFQSAAYLGVGPVTGYTAAGLADLDGDGHPDLLWQNKSTGALGAWYLTGALGNQFSTYRDIGNGAAPGWRICGVVDINQDGHPDVIFQNTTTSQVAVWYLGGTNGNVFQGFNWLAPNGVTGWSALMAK